MVAEQIDWSKLHGQIIDFKFWLEQKIDRCLNNLEARVILEFNGLDENLLDKMKPGQLIAINHSQKTWAICKDTANNFRYISKIPKTKKPSE